MVEAASWTSVDARRDLRCERTMSVSATIVRTSKLRSFRDIRVSVAVASADNEVIILAEVALMALEVPVAVKAAD